MKVFVIKSYSAPQPLAEVRTDGRQVDFVVDNTDGRLPKMVGRNYSKLIQLMDTSSSMYMEAATSATAQLLRYVLDNGDVAEITTDGKTAMLNGTLLDENEKNVLFNSIRTGEIKVARKADRATPVPVLPPATKLRPNIPSSMDKDLVNEMKKSAKQQDEEERNSSAEYDHQIEKADLRDADDPEYARDMMYRMKYGVSRGGK